MAFEKGRAKWRGDVGVASRCSVALQSCAGFSAGVLQLLNSRRVMSIWAQLWRATLRACLNAAAFAERVFLRAEPRLHRIGHDVFAIAIELFGAADNVVVGFRLPERP